MSRFRYAFSRILDLVKAASKNQNFQAAGTMIFDQLADKIAQAAGNPELVRALASEVKKGAPALVGAMVKGTEAENLVDPGIVHQADEGTAAGGTPPENRSGR